MVVHTSIRFDPDRYDEAVELVRDLAERSRREEATVRYRAMADLDDEYTVRFFEQYEDEAAWTAHTETDHYERFVERLPDLVDDPVETINIVAPDALDVHQFTAADVADDA